MIDRRLTVPLAALVLALPLLVSPATAGAQEPEGRYWVESFDSQITVTVEGVVEVAERLVFRFDGSFNGVYRDIPLEYKTPWGLDYDLRLEVLSVTGEAQRALRYETSNRRGNQRIKVWVPGAVNASRTVVLRYQVERALRFPQESEDGFDSYDELYWNVTGDRWSVPILAASATVILPDLVYENPRVRAFSGRYGSANEDVRIDHPDRHIVVFESERRLDPGEGFTVVVGWPAGIVHRPTAAERAGELLADNWPLGTPLVVFALMLVAFKQRGRDPRVDRSVVVRYEPPDGVSPAELGTLVDERVDLRDIVATVLDLAVRGYLRIEESVEEGWLGDSTTTTFVRLLPADEALRTYERVVLDGLFESGDQVTMEDLKTRFYAHLATIKRDLYDRLTQQGLFRSRPDRVRGLWFGIAGLALAASVGLGLVLGKPAFLIAAPFTAIAVGAFAPFMPARTVAGRERYLEIKGFEEFLGRTEAERLNALALPETVFERYLPYAMALGVADHWAKLFTPILSEPPNWYQGPAGRFNALGFGHRMNHMGTALGTAMATAPRSNSGSSGFSGGGFSGGGFGGGGGGAF